MKHLFFLCLVLLSFANLYSQNSSGDNLVSFEFKNHGLGFFLGEKVLEKETNSLNSLCESGVFFVRFQIEGGTKVVNIRFSDGTNSELQHYFEDILKKTDGFWKVKTGYKGEYIILPICYTLGKKCTPVDKTYVSLANMLKYDGKTDISKPGFLGGDVGVQLSCILMPVFYFQNAPFSRSF